MVVVYTTVVTNCTFIGRGKSETIRPFVVLTCMDSGSLPAVFVGAGERVLPPPLPPPFLTLCVPAPCLQGQQYPSSLQV